MTTVAWVAIGGLLISAIVQLVAIVVWGARLTQRVKTIEEELEPLKALSLQVARMEVKLDGLLEQFKDLNSSVRWMREPAAPYRPRMPKGASE